MPCIEKCCFCCDLRAGSQCSAWYTLLIAAILLIYSLVLFGLMDWVEPIFAMLVNISRSQMDESEKEDRPDWSVEVADIIKTLTDSMLALAIFAGIMIILCILLSCGVCMSKRWTFLPYCFMMIVWIIAKLACGFLTAVLWEWGGFVIGLILFIVVAVALDIYCIVCVMSYYKALGEDGDKVSPMD